jgi:hypothetical protein
MAISNSLSEKLLLLENLMQRFEYNEKQRTYTIKGTITKAEFDAIKSARNRMEHAINELHRKKGGM